MIALRKVLSEHLKALHPRVYFQQAPEKAIFPYIIYDIPNSFSDGEGFEIATIDIDGWDWNSSGDTTEIENMMVTINTLDKKILSSEEISVTFYLENKMSLQDDDKRIKRRKYIYQAKLFRKG